ncbi:MAG TPA: HD domain-containing protein [Clostridia bacterium]|nr:HD domain-containing protein [Clostridia bacterium]
MKQQIIELLRSTERPGIENLIQHMEESDFFMAPCSTQYHLCINGGLAEHSMNVYTYMTLMYQSTKHWDDSRFEFTLNNLSHDSVVIVSLLHDIGKASYRGKPNYIPNILKSGEVSKAKPYESNSDRLYIPHEVVSLQIISKYIELTEEEEFAILYHNGMYVPSGRDINGKERPLQLLLHFADMWCSRFVEVE